MAKTLIKFKIDQSNKALELMSKANLVKKEIKHNKQTANKIGPNLYWKRGWFFALVNIDFFLKSKCSLDF